MAQRGCQAWGPGRPRSSFATWGVKLSVPWCLLCESGLIAGDIVKPQWQCLSQLPRGVTPGGEGTSEHASVPSGPQHHTQQSGASWMKSFLQKHPNSKERSVQFRRGPRPCPRPPWRVGTLASESSDAVWHVGRLAPRPGAPDVCSF